MTDFRIKPLFGANNIEFDLPAVTVRRLLGGSFEQFKRGKESFPSDHFEEKGVFCYYNSKGLLEALEFHQPARTFLGDKDLLSMHYRQLIPLLTSLDSNVVKDGDGAIFKGLSIGIYAPDANDDDGDAEYEPIEAILIGRPGYYDFLG